MKIGMIGLGKLGYSVALAMQEHGHTVYGWDTDPKIRDRAWDDIRLAEPGSAWFEPSLIFVAVQTPHGEQFDGTHPLPSERADFDYSYLIRALQELNNIGKPLTVAVISTCLPGTMKRIVDQFPNLNITYNPMFVGMGTVIEDYKHPEFVLLGGPDTAKVREFYETPPFSAQIIQTDYTTAEAIKVSYNTFITAKTVLANTWGQLCHKLGINVDDLYNAWRFASDRLISPKYLRAGMSDGGPCHPRDNIALSWLSNELGLEHNYFDGLMKAREAHETFLIDLLPRNEMVIIFGRSFKPNVELEDGSPALLMANLLYERGHAFIHSESPRPGPLNFIATKHEKYKDIQWPQGSIVIDPFGIIADQEGVNVVRVGRR